EDLVLGLVDGAERARAQLLDDLVASGDLGRLGGGRLQAHGYPLARRPAEAAAPDQVQVDVVDAVSRIVTGVEDQPEAPLGQAQVGGQVAGASHQAPHEGVVAGGQVQDARDVALGHDEDVDRALRVDVVEGQDRVVLVGHAGRDLPGHDLAEQAGHGDRVYTRVRPPRCRAASSAGTASTGRAPAPPPRPRR